MTHETDLLTDAAAPLLAVLPPVAWLPHRLVKKPNGDLDKPPCQGARTNDARTWFTFDAARDLLHGKNDVAGIGFAIVAGIVALDFDRCRDPFTGLLDAEVQREVERLESYAYVTPSHTGIRIVGLNNPDSPLQGGKSVRWLPGGHKIEIFVGPVSFYNTFTAETIPGSDTLRDISDETLDYLTALDAGRNAAANGATHTVRAPNPDPQRSIAAIVAALACIPNTVQDWDAWSRIGMAAWRASGGRGAGLDAWITWSAKHPCHDPGACEERWQHWFASPPTRIGFGTLYYEARKWRPLFVAPFDPVGDPVDDPPPGVGDNEDGGDGTATGDKLPFEILDTPAFLATFTMPDYLIDGIIQRGRLHALTSPTGHGKTAVALFLACMMATARNIGVLEVTQGNILFLAGENPDDLCVRLHAACQVHGIMPGMLPIYFMPGNFPLDPEAAEKLKQQIDGMGITFSLIIGDSLAAYFPGDDENHNVQMGAYARNWRVLTTCVGRPAVLALAHPIKAATRDNLLPRGGGAFLAEIDVNLTLWAEGDREVTTLHWQGKIRGADFQPVTFGLSPVVLNDKKDVKGRSLPSVVATLRTTEQAEQSMKVMISDENAVLEHLRRSPGISIKDIALECGWASDTGLPNKARVYRRLKTLEDMKLAKNWRGKWIITDAGKAELKGTETG